MFLRRMEKMDPELTEKLIFSMPRRLQVVIASRKSTGELIYS